MAKSVLLLTTDRFADLKALIDTQRHEVTAALQRHRQPPVVTPVVTPPRETEIECPLGKQAFATKKEAWGRRPGEYGKRAVSTFRCDFCGYIHLGRRR